VTETRANEGSIDVPLQKTITKGVGIALVLANWIMGFWAVAWVRYRFGTPDRLLVSENPLILGHAMVLGVDRPPRYIAADPAILQRRYFDLPPP
jgi:hypothetical protein